MPVQTRPRDADSGADVVHRHAVEAVAGEQSGGGVEDLRAPGPG
jgi:hypothetical protein